MTRRAPAIVVLGAPLAPDDRLSPILHERVVAAAALYRELVARGERPVVVATGGITRGARRAEAAVIAEALAAHAVPDVLVEAASRTTEDNARLTAALLAPLGVGDVYVVTQPFHVRRATWLFRAAGLAARAHHIVDSVQYRDRWRALKWQVRECGAWAKLAVTRATSAWRARR